MTQGPIVIIEDDMDDQEIYTECIHRLGINNPIKLFENGAPALEYLYTTTDKPFIIISDVNMPVMDGITLKTKIQEDPVLRVKGIPFVFISTNGSQQAVKKAHVLSVQGYFKKPGTMDEIHNMLKVLFEYWALCLHINNT